MRKRVSKLDSELVRKQFKDEKLKERIQDHYDLVMSGDSVRSAARKTGWSKTTVDKDCHSELLTKKEREAVQKVLKEHSKLTSKVAVFRW